jgi:hypothetical protein
VDCQVGNDNSGTGSYTTPWKSFKNIGSYEFPNLRPAGWKELRPGDVIYLKGSGVCSEHYTPGPTIDRAMIVISSSGTEQKPIVLKRYPGGTAVLTPQFVSSFPGNIVRLNSASFIKIEDLELTGSYANPMYFTAASNIEVSRVRCHNTQGSTLYNIACINAALPNNHYIHHNEFSNVYDPTSPRAENVSLIVYFGGSNNKFEYNRLFYTNAPNYSGPIAGRCLKYKHPSANGPIVVRGNQFLNCWDAAIDNSSSDILVEKNLFWNDPTYNGAVFYKCGDIGGGAMCRNGIVRFNTAINSRAYAQRESINSNLGTTNFYQNIVIDNTDSYSSENGFFRIERYGDNAKFNTYESKLGLVTNNNCYHNNRGRSLVFDYFGDSGSGTLGGMYSFSSWQSKGYDSASQVTDPHLDPSYISLSSECADKGWRQQSNIEAPSPPIGLSGSVR